MQQLIHSRPIHICYNGEYITQVIKKEGIIEWANETAVCFKSVGEEYVVPWTSIRFLKVLK